MENNHRDSKAGILIGLVLAAAALVIAYNTSQMRIPPTYAKVGPQVFPYLAALALAGTGFFFIYQTLSGQRDRIIADTDVTDWRAILFISGGFLFEIVFIKRLGFVLCAAVLFIAVAYAFGSRRYLRDIVTALLLSTAAYLVFTKLLNLQLPPGILKGLM
jgi:putative tricarboxylic transport membrane protein